MHDCGWEAWIRVLTPDEIPDIARDLEDLSPDADLDEYALHYLHKAREFVSQLASEGRGMVYMIG